MAIGGKKDYECYYSNNPHVWYSNSSGCVHICEMSDEHLRNTILFLEKRGEPYTSQYYIMKKELNYRINNN